MIKIDFTISKWTKNDEGGYDLKTTETATTHPTKDEAIMWANAMLERCERGVAKISNEDGTPVGEMEWNGSSLSYPWREVWY